MTEKPSLNEQRRRLEREREGLPPMSECPIHGEHEGEICVKCYSKQQERIERESAELRALRTPDFMRRQRSAALAEMNGGSV